MRPAAGCRQGALTPSDEAHIALVLSLFREHVDTKQLVTDLAEASANPGEWVREQPGFPGTDGVVVAAKGSGKRARPE